jgi:mannosylfructose-6-phosphate phosphatase
VERLNLIISDLDDTLLGDDAALRRFAVWYDEMRPNFRLAYSSGRFRDSIRQSIAETDLPEPDAVICGVGTEIYAGDADAPLPGWPQIVPKHWDATAINAVCATFCELELQPDEFQSRYKISFYAYDLDEACLARLRQALDAAGQKASVVYSSNRDLDILPARTHKGAAAGFLVDHWMIDRRCVIVAGDSGNDATMFHEGFRGIIVGNAKPELRAVSGPRIYHAADSYAAGVVEGLDHWLAELTPAAVKFDRAS